MKKLIDDLIDALVDLDENELVDFIKAGADKIKMHPPGVIPFGGTVLGRNLQ